MGKERALIGVDQVHYALITSDTASGATWEVAVAMPGITEVGVNPNGSLATLFADNVPVLAANTIGEIDISLKMADLTPLEKSILLGHTRTGGITSYKGTDSSPDVAIGFRTLLSDGTYGYAWLMKGKFAEAQEPFATKADKTEFQMPTLSGKFLVLTYNGEWKRTTRADDPDYVAATGANWFTNGPLGTTDTTPPTVSVSPADAATGVVVSANIVWTFSEAIHASEVTAGNFFVIKDDGTAVLGTLSIGTNNTVVTFDPTSNFSASTDYLAIATSNVRNLAGIALAANSVTNFQTA